MIQDVTDLKENESGDASGAVDASVDWDAINASIRVKAWQGFKAGLYRQQDLRDVEQQLAVWVLERLNSFDPERGTLATFLKHALRSGLSNINRKANAAFRSLPADTEMTSFSSMVDSSDGPPVALSDTLTTEDLGRRNGTSSRSQMEEFEFIHDIETLIQSLTKDQAAIARALMTEGRTNAYKASGLTLAHFKTTMEEIAKRFSQGGYDLFDHLPNAKEQIECS